jgi:hypothetical protein
LAGGAVMGAFGGADVVGDRCGGDAEVFGDHGVGPAFDQAAFDLGAFGGGVVGGGFAFVGEFALAFEPGGAGDFVAEEEAAADLGDGVVPGVGGGPGDLAAEVVAFGAGERWCGWGGFGGWG